MALQRYTIFNEEDLKRNGFAPDFQFLVLPEGSVPLGWAGRGMAPPLGYVRDLELVGTELVGAPVVTDTYQAPDDLFSYLDVDAIRLAACFHNIKRRPYTNTIASAELIEICLVVSASSIRLPHLGA